VITLLTDFGLADPYAGIMKGVILSANPDAVIVDLTHDIPPQDIMAAAYAIDSAFRYFPAGTIHIMVVDPGVGGERKILAAIAAGHVFLAPDNGVLTLILKSGAVDRIFQVENSRYFLHPVSRTFHGRDVFAPVAGHLSNGLSPAALGPETDPGRGMMLGLPLPRVTPGREIAGCVTRVDRFGNLITNIEQSQVAATFGKTDPRGLKIAVGGSIITGLSGAYRDAPSGALLVLFGSAGWMEIAVNGGSAAEVCAAAVGSPVVIFKEDGPES
jgi:S-adenosylmethionine hydrolase